MKNKKLISLVLSVIIALSCCVIAYAGGDGPLEKDGIFYYSVNYSDEYGSAAYIEDVDSSATGEITIPAKLGGYTIEIIFPSAFSRSKGITKILVSSDNARYSSDSYGVLFNKDKSALVRCPVGTTMTSYTIPSTVKQIYSYAFKKCTNLQSIVIPKSVEDISLSAFDDATNLKNVYFEGTKEEWGKLGISSELTGVTVSYDYNQEPSAGDSDSGALDLFGGIFTLIVSFPALFFSFMFAPLLMLFGI